MTQNGPIRRPGLWLIFALLVIGLGAGLFLAVEDSPMRKPELTFSIRFDDITGIRERSRVFFLGIPVGYVNSLAYEPEPNNPSVRVDVVITRKIKLPGNVIAHLEPSLLGDASIALRLPENSVPVKGEPALASGAEVHGERATKLEAVMPGFDAALAKLQAAAQSTEQRFSEFGLVVDQSMATLRTVFFETDANGLTPIDNVTRSLQDLVNGPEGQHDVSLRSQLQSIVNNLQASSDNVRKLSDLQSKQSGSIGQVLQAFEDTARKLSEDASAAQKVMGRLGHTSDAVTQASEQVNNLAAKASQAVEEFHSRPMHFLTTTHGPIEQKPAPSGPRH